MKNEKVKSLLIFVLAIGLISMTIAYALISQKLDIKSTATIPKTTWDVHFANGKVIESTNPSNSGIIKTPPSLSPYLITGLEAKLEKAGDEVKYTFDIYNSGNVDAKIGEYEKIINKIICKDSNGSEESSDAIEVCNSIIYNLKYTENTTKDQTGTIILAGTDLSVGQKLKAKQKINVTLTLSIDINASFKLATDVTVSGLDSYIVYTQD